MRRLARHAFTALSALSLLLCVAVCVLWVRSYRVNDWVGYVTRGGVEVEENETKVAERIWYAASGAGGIAVGFANADHRWDHLWPTYVRKKLADPGFSHRANPRTLHPIPVNPASFWSRLGFRRYHQWLNDKFGMRVHRAYAIPHWALALGMALLPARSLGLCVRRWRGRRRMRAG